MCTLEKLLLHMEMGGSKIAGCRICTFSIKLNLHFYSTDSIQGKATISL